RHPRLHRHRLPHREPRSERVHPRTPERAPVRWPGTVVPGVGADDAAPFTTLHGFRAETVGPVRYDTDRSGPDRCLPGGADRREPGLSPGDDAATKADRRAA